MSVPDGMVQGVTVVTATWNERENIEQANLMAKFALKCFLMRVTVEVESHIGKNAYIGKNGYSCVNAAKRRFNQSAKTGSVIQYCPFSGLSIML